MRKFSTEQRLNTSETIFLAVAGVLVVFSIFFLLQITATKPQPSLKYGQRVVLRDLNGFFPDRFFYAFVKFKKAKDTHLFCNRQENGHFCECDTIFKLGSDVEVVENE